MVCVEFIWTLGITLYKSCESHKPITYPKYISLCTYTQNILYHMYFEAECVFIFVLFFTYSLHSHL